MEPQVSVNKRFGPHDCEDFEAISTDLNISTYHADLPTTAARGDLSDRILRADNVSTRPPRRRGLQAR